MGYVCYYTFQNISSFRLVIKTLKYTELQVSSLFLMGV